MTNPKQSSLAALTYAIELLLNVQDELKSHTKTANNEVSTAQRAVEAAVSKLEELNLDDVDVDDDERNVRWLESKEDDEPENLQEAFNIGFECGRSAQVEAINVERTEHVQKLREEWDDLDSVVDDLTHPSNLDGEDMAPLLEAETDLEYEISK